MFRSLLLLLIPAALCAQQLTFATYQGGSAVEATAGVVRDSLGNLYLAGSTESTDFPVVSAAGGGFVVKLDANGNRLAATLLPGSPIAAIALDASNNVFVAGTKAAGSGFIAKLSSALAAPAWTYTFAASPIALAVDSAGAVYAAGSAQASFVTTTGVLQPALKGVFNAFILKLSADGTMPLYATFLGGSGVDSANAISVDSSGNVSVTGATTSADFPLANAAQTQFGGVLPILGGELFGDAFVAKLDSNGATLLYSTYLGGAAADAGYAIALDGSGNAYVAGATQSATWLAGPAGGTFQTAYAGPAADPNYPDPEGDAFLAKFSPTGGLLWYTYLGGAGEDVGTAIALDAAGNIYVAGDNGSTNFPVAGSPVPDCHLGSRPFLAEFNPAGAKLLVTTGLSGMGYDQVYGMALDAAHNGVYLAGNVESVVFFATPGAAQATYGGGDDDSFLARVDLATQPTLAVGCVVNAASYLAGNVSSYPTGAVAPGEIVSLFGLGLGPTPAAPLQLTASGTVSTAIGGMSVLFDGIPAPLLYAGPGQLNAVVPYGIHTSGTSMTVTNGSLTAGPIPMPVVSAVPAIFLCGAYCNDPSQAAVVNSDYSLNTVANPAERGDYITLYVCGAGLMSDVIDGDVSAPPYATALANVTVSMRGVDARVQYAGAAPGFVNGLMQINAYIPTGIDFGNHVPLSVKIGNNTSQDNVTIAVK
ncbi:MAG TPA: SBBP repeat-containing protein [Bryobacteraceae bacterium]|jgi:uncharacterized protein (TIGR03437 family)|nr:SBBP repeat-containing protein [Bryobacteraceae bacterium]